MLYVRWRRIAREHADELALVDLPGGKRWTFAQLNAAAESLPSPTGPVVFPTGPTAAFVLDVLRAWRDDRVVCPLDSGQSAPAIHRVPDGCAHLKTTSASTGSPRVVAFSDDQLAADAGNIVATMGLRADWPNLGVISLAHSYGFSNLVLPLLLHGIPLILAGSPLPETVRRAAANAGDVTLAAVPALWRAWHEANAISPNVRLAISAGAPLPRSLEQEIFAASGLKVHNFYGSSECGGIAFDSTERPREDASCVGAPMKNVLLSICDAGCVEVRSRAVGMTYLPESDERLANGCFRTSDLGKIENGNVFLLGRAGDQINVAGRKLLPESVERELRAHPAVRECVVFGAPSKDAERSDTIVACVAARRKTTTDELKQFLLGRLPPWQVPREWWFVESLETNQRGKISRAELRAKYVAGAS